MEERDGADLIDLLREKRDSGVKVPKTEEKEISAHYRKELKIIEARRADGEQGYIDFQSWQ